MLGFILLSRVILMVCYQEFLHVIVHIDVIHRQLDLGTRQRRRQKWIDRHTVRLITGCPARRCRLQQVGDGDHVSKWLSTNPNGGPCLGVRRRERWNIRKVIPMIWLNVDVLQGAQTLASELLEMFGENGFAMLVDEGGMVDEPYRRC